MTFFEWNIYTQFLAGIATIIATILTAIGCFFTYRKRKSVRQAKLSQPQSGTVQIAIGNNNKQNSVNLGKVKAKNITIGNHHD
ncbi:MAG: hypothetical protein QM523_05980 [Candidatus Pacebacteria bacterium]|nr:hypothetical protein [Candidatus Paceibacterota bacterium]